jgi:putative sterol carrier protein
MTSKKIDVADAMLDANVLMELLAVAKSIKKPYQLSLENPNRDWTIDFEKNKITAGKADKPDLTITMQESAVHDLIAGKATPLQLFMGGKIKAKGNMGVLMKLQGLQPKLDKLRSKY